MFYFSEFYLERKMMFAINTRSSRRRGDTPTEYMPTQNTSLDKLNPEPQRPA